jgi:hypothetical protein
MTLLVIDSDAVAGATTVLVVAVVFIAREVIRLRERIAKLEEHNRNVNGKR